MGWSHLTHDREKNRAVLKEVISLSVPQNERNFLRIKKISFPMTLFPELTPLFIIILSIIGNINFCIFNEILNGKI